MVINIFCKLMQTIYIGAVKNYSFVSPSLDSFSFNSKKISKNILIYLVGKYFFNFISFLFRY
jgi:hypothetical protein